MVELAKVMERSVLLAEDGALTYDCLCTEISAPASDTQGQVVFLNKVVEEAERKAILNAMRASDNNRSEAVRLLGISQRALYDKLARYALT